MADPISWLAIGSTILSSVGASAGAAGGAALAGTAAAGLTTAEIIGLAGTGLGAVGSILEGQSAASAAEAEGIQAIAQAKSARATSQRQANEERRQGDLAISRAQAVAAAGGGGATDPTVLNIVGDIAGQSEYNALSALYEGTTAADTLEYQAKIKAMQARDAKIAGYIGAGSKLLSGGASLYDRYSGGGPPNKTKGYG